MCGEDIRGPEQDDSFAEEDVRAPAELAVGAHADLVAEAAGFIEVHRRSFATRVEAERWFGYEAERLRTLKRPETARGLFEEALAEPETGPGDFGDVLQTTLVTPRGQEAPLTVGACLRRAKLDVADWLQMAAEAEQRMAEHREARRLWQRLLADPKLLELRQERDSALARAELHRATLARIEARWREEEPEWEQAAAAKRAERLQRQGREAERLEGLRPAVLAELERREANPTRRLGRNAELAEYVRESLDRGVPAEELWLDMVLHKGYSLEEQEELDVLLRAMQTERQRERLG